MAEILIAEDEDILRKNLALILGSAGHSVKAVNNGAKALEALEKKSFDIVITDLLMPVMGGGELIEHISRTRPDTAIIIVTAYPSSESAIHAIKKGVVDYFIKPFRPEDILKSINSVVESKSQVPMRWERLGAIGLTPKEETLLRLIIEEGISENSELAERLSIKVTTVKQHLENIFRKFDVSGKPALITAVIAKFRE